MDNFEERLTVYVDETSRRECMQEKYYWLTLCLFCTWPYRYWFRATTKKKHFIFVKLLEV